MDIEIYTRVQGLKQQEREIMANKWDCASDNIRNNWSPAYAALLKAASEIERKRKLNS